MSDAKRCRVERQVQAARRWKVNISMRRKGPWQCEPPVPWPRSTVPSKQLVLRRMCTTNPPVVRVLQLPVQYDRTAVARHGLYGGHLVLVLVLVPVDGGSHEQQLPRPPRPNGVLRGRPGGEGKTKLVLQK